MAFKTQEELEQIFAEEYGRSPDAQELHDLERSLSAPQTDKQIEMMKQMLADSPDQSAPTSSKGTSSSPKDLVGLVMQTHGMDEKTAIEMIEAFGG